MMTYDITNVKLLSALSQGSPFNQLTDLRLLPGKYYQFAPYLNHISLSVYDAVKRDQEEVDTITALASLSMQHPNK